MTEPSKYVYCTQCGRRVLLDQCVVSPTGSVIVGPEHLPQEQTKEKAA